MTLHLNLPDDLKSLAESRARESGHSSLDAYLVSLIRADADQDISAELEAQLIEGIESGPPVEATPQYWADLKRRAQERLVG